jgi:transcriptional regulator with XRE-family HTH domain
MLDLADYADLSIDTIAHYESGDDEYTYSVIESIQVALEYGGVEFCAPDDQGVRLRC